MRRALFWLVLFCAAGGIVWRWPLFRIVPLDEARQKKLSMTFDANAFVEKLWEESLMDALGRAVAAPVLFGAIDRDPEAAKNRYSQTVGISSVYYYFVAGTGQVVSVDEDAVTLSLGGNSDGDVVIETGMIFGNAIRNGTGLVDVNEYPNSQDFNNISRELNRIVEERVLPPFRKAVEVGARVRFAGCAEIKDEERDLRPMQIVPVAVEVQ